MNCPAIGDQGRTSGFLCGQSNRVGSLALMAKAMHVMKVMHVRKVTVGD